MTGNPTYPIIPGGLTPEDHERIRALAEQGLKAYSIGRQIQRHASTVQWFMYRDGLMPPPSRKPRKAFRRGAQIVRPFTPEEDTFIEQLRCDGLPVTEIAERVEQQFGYKRPRESIGIRLCMLAAEEAA